MFVWVQFGAALPRSLAAYQLMVRFIVICLLDITKLPISKTSKYRIVDQCRGVCAWGVRG